MLLVLEMRVPMPMTLQEYEASLLYSVAKQALLETGGGEGVQVLENKEFSGVPLFNGRFNSGRYTKKIYHGYYKMPVVVRLLLGKDGCQFHEASYNCGRYCETSITLPNSKLTRDRYKCLIKTLVVEDDRGGLPNALELSAEELQHRKIAKIDISQMDDEDDADPMHPAKFKSKVGRGPLIPGEWIKTTSPCLTVYKVVLFEWDGLGQKMMHGKVEKQSPLLQLKMHRLIWANVDEVLGKSMREIRCFEEETAKELDKRRLTTRKIVGTKMS